MTAQHLTERPLNIGVVCYPTHGGSGVVAVEIAHGLDKRGHNVHVISYDRPARLDTLHTNIVFNRVNVPEYPLFEYPPYSMALAAQLADVITKYDLDVIHAHYALPHAVSGWLARKLTGKRDIAIVTTLHGTDITIVGADPSYLPITRFSIDASDAVTVVSKWLGGKIHEILGCKCKEEVVYNFVDTDVYSPVRDPRLKTRLCRKTPVITHMSNFRPVKRITDVVDTFLRVREKMRVQLVMVGDGPERCAAEQRLLKTPYADDVHFIGIHDSAYEILPCSDVFLFPSNAESFGLAALEAMACGVPVVGANAGGLPEVVDDGSGILVEPENVDALVDAILKIVSDQNTRKVMGEHARQRALSHFQVENALDRYEQIYCQAIHKVREDGPCEEVPD